MAVLKLGVRSRRPHGAGNLLKTRDWQYKSGVVFEAGGRTDEGTRDATTAESLRELKEGGRSCEELQGE